MSDEWEYTWCGLPIPGWAGDWLTELAEVRVGIRLTLILIGFIAGLLAALTALLAGIWLAYT